jgi:hypothetical protein
MTTLQMIALLVTPVGGLLVGLAAYWIATRPEKHPRHHPAE